MARRRDTQLSVSLRRAVLRRLDQLDQVATRGDSRALLPLARTELNRLADGWRLLLDVHSADDNGRCAACPRRIRGRRWPCQVWRMAHRHLIGDGEQRANKHRPRALLRAVRRPNRREQPEPPPVVAAEFAGRVPPPCAEEPGELTMELPVVRPRRQHS